MELRYYQKHAVQAVYNHLREKENNPCVVIPTAGGKTPVIAKIAMDVCKSWNGRTLILSHVKELLQQSVRHLEKLCPELKERIGVYSAGLKSRDTTHDVIVAGIQSIYKRAAELGKIDIIMIDEAHLIPPDGEGMYQTFLTAMKEINPQVRLIGLTATPFRMKSGLICAPENLLNEICYEVGVKELMVAGYLSPLKSKAGLKKPDTDKLHIRMGEFIEQEVDELMDTDELVEAACQEIVEMTKDRKSVLVFCSSVKHGQHVMEVLNGLEQSVAAVFGETSSNGRANILASFKEGAIKYLVNVNVLTTGFDAPNIDGVILLRPTASPGLLYQMVGRGFRINEGKEDCLVLDYGNNILRHGPIDAIRVRAEKKRKKKSDLSKEDAPARECAECRSLVAIHYTSCPECGHEFPRQERSPNHSSQASNEAVLSTDDVSSVDYEVQGITYRSHTKYIKDGVLPGRFSRSMRVQYEIGWNTYVSEWICFEHKGYARKKAEGWWKVRSNEPVPSTVEEAVQLCRFGAIKKTVGIIVDEREKYPRILSYLFGGFPTQEEIDKQLSV